MGRGGGLQILFDTGQGNALIINTRKADVDLTRTKALILSHGHYDHTGGITQILQLAQKIPVYCHPGILQPRCVITEGIARSIHMPKASIDAITKPPTRLLHWVREPIFVSGLIWITSPIPRLTSFEDTGGPFYLDTTGIQADPIEDELAIWVQTVNGLVICTGCAHAGLINTLRYVQQLNYGNRLTAVIGGFHLLTATKERLTQTIAALQQLGPDVIIPCHCTGQVAMDLLKDAFGERVLPSKAGMTYQL